MQNNRGSALITALFIMTLVAIAATAMSTRLQLDIYRTQLTIASDKLYLASQAVTFWAMDTLAIHPIKFKNEGHEVGEVAHFPKRLQRAYPDVIVKGTLYDMQALFNLNNLQDRKYHALFFKIIRKALPKSEESQRGILLSSIYAWISPYQPDRGQDVFLTHYLHQHPPYLPGYQPMKSISELRLVRDVNVETYQSLLHYFTVLPTTTPIKINMAPKAILESLNGLSETQVDELLQARGTEGFTNKAELDKLLQKFNIPIDQITLESAYYLSKATATSDDLELTTYALIKRSKDNKGVVSVSIVSESLNTV